jgi:hypothetical protein
VRGTTRRLLVALGMIVALGGVVVARVLVAGRSELELGRKAAEARDDEAALRHLRRAARWYLPGSPYPERAMEALDVLAETAQARGDLRLARRAHEAVRGAILSTRSFYVPSRARLKAANSHIASLLAAEEGDAADPGKSPKERTAYHLALLEHDRAPSVGWSIVALCGLGAFLLGAVIFCFRAIGPDDRLDRRAAAICGTIVIAGFATFLLGLVNA